jgi:putative peptidoglycan lipid II flippase
VVGHLLLRRRFGILGFRAVGRTVGLIGIAAAAGAAAALVVVLVLDSLLGTGRASGLLQLLLGGALGLAVTGRLAMRLPLPEVAEIMRAIRPSRNSVAT